MFRRVGKQRRCTPFVATATPARRPVSSARRPLAHGSRSKVQSAARDEGLRVWTPEEFAANNVDELVGVPEANPSSQYRPLHLEAALAVVARCVRRPSEDSPDFARALHTLLTAHRLVSHTPQAAAGCAHLCETWDGGAVWRVRDGVRSGDDLAYLAIAADRCPGLDARLRQRTLTALSKAVRHLVSEGSTAAIEVCRPRSVRLLACAFSRSSTALGVWATVLRGAEASVASVETSLRQPWLPDPADASKLVAEFETNPSMGLSVEVRLLYLTWLPASLLTVSGVLQALSYCGASLSRADESPEAAAALALRARCCDLLWAVVREYDAPETTRAVERFSFASCGAEEAEEAAPRCLTSVFDSLTVGELADALSSLATPAATDGPGAQAVRAAAVIAAPAVLRNAGVAAPGAARLRRLVCAGLEDLRPLFSQEQAAFLSAWVGVW